MFKNIFGWSFVLISLVLPACRGRLDQEYNAIERDCGASWVQKYPNHNFYPIETENGETPRELRASWLSPVSKSAVKLDISPNNCIAVPSNQGQGLILVGRKETSAMTVFAPTSSAWRQPLKLTRKSNLKIDLSCPRGGIFARSQASVAVKFSLDQQALTPEEAAKILRLYTITVSFKQGETTVASFPLSDWQQLKEPAALKLLQYDPTSEADTTTAPITQLFTKQGSYHAILEWRNFLDENDRQDSPSLCPIEIDSEAPDTPLLTVATIGDAPFLPVGARLPLFVGTGNELHFHIDRIASQQLYKKWSSLSAKEQAAQVFEVGSLPAMERPGIYRLRAYAEDKAGNRSEVFEQILNVLEPHAVYQSLPDGWQILSLENNQRSLMVGPKWNGKAYVLAWAELQGAAPQKIQVSDQLITPYPKLLKGWQTVQSVKGFFGFGGNQSEQICFYQPSRIGEGSLGHMQCLGWQDGQWKVFAEQVSPHADNEILIPADVNADQTTDILAQDVSIGLVRTLAFRDGVLVPTPDFRTGNLGTYGASANKAIMPLSRNNTDGPVGMFLTIPSNSEVTCFGVNLGERTINLAVSGMLIGAFNNSGHGLPLPIKDQGFYFPLLQTFNFRQSIGPDMDDKRFTKLYNWSDEGHNLTAWNFDNCWRAYAPTPTAGLPDLTGRRIQVFRTQDTFHALVYPLNNVLAEPFESWRFNGKVWSIESMVENPSARDQTAPETDDPKLTSSPNRLDSGWYDFSEGSRSWGGMSVQQGNALPFAARPGYTLYYRWTNARKKTTQEPYQKSPLLYPQELGTFLFEMRAVKSDEAAPAATDTPDVRRVVGVMTPTTTTRGALPGLGMLLQVKPGETLSRVNPKLHSTRPGYLQWTVQSIEEQSQTTTFELEQPWATDLEFFSQQNLTVVMGRFGFANGNPESICYIRKASLDTPDQGHMACLGWVDGKWQWLLKDLEIAINSNQEVQTIELAEPGLGISTHLLTMVSNGRSVRVAKWNPVLTNFEFSPMDVYGPQKDANNVAYSLPYDEGPIYSGNPDAFHSTAYPIVIHSLDSEDVDTIMTGYPYDPDSTYDGSLYLNGSLTRKGDNFTLAGDFIAEHWGWMRPYPSDWYSPEFVDGQLAYGRRYLRSQLLQVPLPGEPSVYRLGWPDDFSTTLFYSKNQKICEGAPCLRQAFWARKMDFMHKNHGVMTMAVKAYRNADGKLQQILAITPPNVDDGYQFLQWTCDGAICNWKKILTLRPEGN